ncbi:hypothetical protein QBC34DRAFT_444174 [Podospora aff. communis PSN243]|uniref:CCHC-type domain-containing protein n=1 Tax=Podospora aff. communis PSN243 TaxID=3040156 RepID=A0AAV9G3P9_9PEZI|nr:hypothetical protein QBC34DRAFT_444174 [Podospora aff. communis PSN243]
MVNFTRYRDIGDLHYVHRAGEGLDCLREKLRLTTNVCIPDAPEYVLLDLNSTWKNGWSTKIGGRRIPFAARLEEHAKAIEAENGIRLTDINSMSGFLYFLPMSFHESALACSRQLTIKGEPMPLAIASSPLGVPVTCGKCDAPGHMFAECPHRALCKRCGKGHWQGRQCRKFSKSKREKGEMWSICKGSHRGDGQSRGCPHHPTVQREALRAKEVRELGWGPRMAEGRTLIDTLRRDAQFEGLGTAATPAETPIATTSDSNATTSIQPGGGEPMMVDFARISSTCTYTCTGGDITVCRSGTTTGVLGPIDRHAPSRTGAHFGSCTAAAAAAACFFRHAAQPEAEADDPPSHKESQQSPRLHHGHPQHDPLRGERETTPASSASKHPRADGDAADDGPVRKRRGRPPKDQSRAATPSVDLGVDVPVSKPNLTRPGTDEVSGASWGFPRRCRPMWAGGVGSMCCLGAVQL